MAIHRTRSAGSLLLRAFVALSFVSLVACGGSGGGGGASTPTAVAGIAPIIAVQPQPQTVGIGQPATFAVTAAGSPAPAYQWLRGGQPIAGATASSFTLNAVQQSDSGATFAVQISNTSGTVQSAQAMLTVRAQPGIALVAGTIGGFGYLDLTGANARFLAATSIAVDAAGNAYVADQSTVRKVTPAGVVTTIAGSPTTPGGLDGPGTAATFRILAGIALDASGNVFVSDRGSNTIRRIGITGSVTTLAGVAGNGGSVDGTGAAAAFSRPGALTVDAAGNVYVADTGNDTIRKITPAGLVTTIAGTAGSIGTVDGIGAAARFNAPEGIAVDAAGVVYVADTGNDTIRVIATSGAVTTLAGAAGIATTTDGIGALARFNAPAALSLDSQHNLYTVERGGDVVRRIAIDASVTTVAGSAGVGGSADGVATAARFLSPGGIASTSTGLVVADSGNGTLRQIAANGTVTTLAGTAAVIGSADGAGALATFDQPFAIAVDASNTVYVGDFLNRTIRKITAAGVVTTLAGSVGQSGTADGAGANARFAETEGLAVDLTGNVYVADRASHTIRKVAPDGTVSTLAGLANAAGSADGTGSGARFTSPTALTVDAVGNVYVVDQSPAVRKITPAGVVTTIAGAAGRVGSTDGAGSGASFNQPQGIAIDAAGVLYVTDSGNATVRRIATNGTVSTIAGAAGQTGTADGATTVARFTVPFGIALDAQGNIFVSDVVPRTVVIGNSVGPHGSHTLRKIDSGTGTVSTIAGVSDNVGGTFLGNLPGHLDSLAAIAIDPAGNLVAPEANGIVRITPP